MMLYKIRDCYEGLWVEVEADTRNEARLAGAQVMGIDYIDTRSVLAERCPCEKCGRLTVFTKRVKDRVCFRCLPPEWWEAFSDEVRALA